MSDTMLEGVPQMAAEGYMSGITPDWTKFLPDVQPGQVWEDCDKRSPNRRLRVIAAPTPEVVASIPNPGELKVTVERVSGGKQTRIKLRRFRPTSTGYRLVS